MTNSNEATPSSASDREALKDALKRSSREGVENSKHFAARQIDGIAGAIGAASAELHRSQPTLAGYATRLADGASRAANRLRDGSLEDLAVDARKLAARNPTLYMVGGVVLGLVAARFLMGAAETETDRRILQDVSDDFRE